LWTISTSQRYFVGTINSEMTGREDIFCILYTCLLYEISNVGCCKPLLAKLTLPDLGDFLKTEMTSTEAKSGKTLLEDSSGNHFTAISIYI